MNAEMIAAACGKARRTAKGYFRCLCPAHDDQRPSLLVVARDDGQLSVRCMAGCENWKVKRALKARIGSTHG